MTMTIAITKVGSKVKIVKDGGGDVAYKDQSKVELTYNTVNNTVDMIIDKEPFDPLPIAYVTIAGTVITNQTVFDTQLALVFPNATSGSGGSGAFEDITGDPEDNAALATVLDEKAQKSVVNLKDYAVADGVTDDRSAIQTAYDAQYALGERVFYLPAATYLFSISSGAYLTIKKGTILFGDGDATILKKVPIVGAGSTAYMIQGDQSTLGTSDISDNNFTVKDLKIIGAKGGRSSDVTFGTGFDGGISIQGTETKRLNKVIVDNVTVTDVAMEGIMVWQSELAVIRNCHVYNCNFDAYNPASNRHIVLTDNYADNVTTGGEFLARPKVGTTFPSSISIIGNTFTNVVEWGLRVFSGDNIDIRSNVFHATGSITSATGEAAGIFISPDVIIGGGSDFPIRNLNIENNKFEGFTWASISLITPHSDNLVIDRIIIKNNHFAKSGLHSVDLKPYDNTKILFTEISGNVFTDWNAANVTGGDIWSNSIAFAAISLENIYVANIFQNSFDQTLAARARNNPLYIKNTDKVTFALNRSSGLLNQSDVALFVGKAGTNTNFINYGNIGLDETDALYSIVSALLTVPTATVGTNTKQAASTAFVQAALGTISVATNTTTLGRTIINSDVTNNNASANTIADVTGLSFAVVAGNTYKFRFEIHYTSAVTTTGSRWAINGPAITDLYVRSKYTLTATTETTNFTNAYDIPAAANATSLTAGNMAIIEGIIKPSANGTVIARFASEVSSSAIVAKAGSFVEYQQII